MADKKPPSHEEAEKVFEASGILISRLPDITETREAHRLVEVASDLVHGAIEKAERASSTP